MADRRLTGSYSPILYDYLRRYQEDPSSRVFAPLAESYRKAGLLKEAVEIAREGLLVHPDFIGGKVALSRAYFDLGQYAEVVQCLEKVVRDVPDNLAAQKLFAESCLMLGRTADALSAFKMLLYHSPQDAETAKLVQELEVESYRGGALVVQDAPRSSIVTQDQVRANRRKILVLQGLLTQLERYRERTGAIT